MGVGMVQVPLHMPVISTSCHLWFLERKRSVLQVPGWSAAQIRQNPLSLGLGYAGSPSAQVKD